MKKAFAHLLKEANDEWRFKNRSQKIIRPFFAIMRVLPSIDGDFSSNFEEFDEDITNNTTLLELLIDNHTL